MSETEPYKRSIILIDRPFQLGVLTYFFIIAAFQAMIIAVASYFAFSGFKTEFAQMGVHQGHEFFKFLEYQESTMMLVIVIACLIQFSFVFVMGIFITHRIAGPIYRLKKYLSEMKPGQDIRPLGFRENDYFQEVPPLLNEFLRNQGILKD